MIRLAWFLLPLTAACSDIPRDPDGTLRRIQETRTIRVGLIASPTRRPEEQAFVGRVSEAARARPVIESGSTEDLLARLERGELDLVLGEFEPASPWAKRVTLIPPLAQGQDGADMVVAAAAKNGENGWIMFLDRHAEALGRGQ